LNALTNTQLVMLGTSLLGCVAGVVGSFAVLRRRALMGDLISHAALPGLCLAFLLLGERQFQAMLLGAFLTGLVGVALVTVLCRWTRTKEDAAIGIVLSTFFGAGVVLTSIIQNLPTESSKAGLQTYIYGQAALMLRQDVWFIALVAAACLALVTALYKEFKVFSFDPGFARAQGWPTLALDLTMMGTLSLVTVVGLPSVGVVLMAAMLIIPGAAARFWTNRLGAMLLLSGVFGAITGVCGTLISAGSLTELLGFDPLAFGYNRSNLPNGPVIVLCGTAIFLFSVLLAPRRGVIARLYHDLRLRWRIEFENLLRTMYELSEPELPRLPEASIAALTHERAWSAGKARHMLRRAAAQGLVETTPAGGRLTQLGLERAERVTRTHRLWELFLIEGAAIAPDHVDRDADSIEHFLSPELVDELEARLAEKHAVPRTDSGVPLSPHELASGEPSVDDGVR